MPRTRSSVHAQQAYDADIKRIEADYYNVKGPLTWAEKAKVKAEKDLAKSRESGLDNVLWIASLQGRCSFKAPFSPHIYSNLYAMALD